jgi:hydroxymethylpyrimidine pyrophosphatase-like HAD family hydrolase
MAAGIRLLSTDFDGTLIGHPSDGRCAPALTQALSDFKASGGLWAVNTGRSLAHAIEGVEIFGAPIEPDFLLTHEREVYRRDATGAWQDFGDWNGISRERHAELFHRSGAIFAQIHSLVTGAPDVTLIEEEGHTAGLITSDEAVMARVAAGLDAMRDAIPKFSYQRNTIYLRFCHADYDKGSVLGELCRLLGMHPGEVFAAGDHYNDLSMLNPKFAAHLACPANAIAEVKSAVASTGGCVSSQRFGEGIASALTAAMLRTEIKKPAGRAAQSAPTIRGREP